MGISCVVTQPSFVESSLSSRLENASQDTHNAGGRENPTCRSETPCDKQRNQKAQEGSKDTLAASLSDVNVAEEPLLLGPHADAPLDADVRDEACAVSFVYVVLFDLLHI